MLVLSAPKSISRLSTNAAHLERWIGAEAIERVSKSMRGFHGPEPIALAGVPGAVYATADGDFIGECRWGVEASWLDYAKDWNRRFKRASRLASRDHRAKLNAGFASLSDLISEATVGGKRQELFFTKSGPTGVINATSTLWRVGSLPQAGGAASAVAAGRACDRTTTGAFNAYQNAAGGDTCHFIGANILATLVNTVLLYDRLFDVAKTVSSNATEAVTGVPTRYQSATATNVDYIGGNFGFIEAFAQVSAVAHNWTVCQYQNETGAGTATLPSVTGVNAAIIDRLDQPLGTWYVPLVAGDLGIKKWTQLQCSVNTVASAINFCIGHPLAWFPCLGAGQVMQIDGINTAFNLIRIFDDACLSMLEVLKPAATATTYTGSMVLCSG